MMDLTHYRNITSKMVSVVNERNAKKKEIMDDTTRTFEFRRQQVKELDAQVKAELEEIAARARDVARRDATIAKGKLRPQITDYSEALYWNSFSRDQISGLNREQVAVEFDRLCAEGAPEAMRREFLRAAKAVARTNGDITALELLKQAEARNLSAEEKALRVDSLIASNLEAVVNSAASLCNMAMERDGSASELTLSSVVDLVDYNVTQASRADSMTLLGED